MCQVQCVSGSGCVRFRLCQVQCVSGSGCVGFRMCQVQVVSGSGCVRFRLCQVQVVSGAGCVGFRMCQVQMCQVQEALVGDTSTVIGDHQTSLPPPRLSCFFSNTCQSLNSLWFCEPAAHANAGSRAGLGADHGLRRHLTLGGS